MSEKLIIIILNLAMIIGAASQTPPSKSRTGSQIAGAAAATVTVDQLLDRYVQSVGGKAAVQKLNTRMMKGSLITPGGTAPMEIYQKAPNKFLIIVNSPVSGLSQNGFNGTVAWSQNTQRGLREMSGPEVENFKREYNLHRELKLKEMYPQMTVKGIERTGVRDAYVVGTSTTDGTSQTMYFDAINGLLIRRDITLQQTTLETYLEDYKEVDGILIPLTIRRKRPDFSFTYKFEEVRHNITIDDAKFEKPAQ